MRQGTVYYNEIIAGVITELNDGSYVFNYEDTYFSNSSLPPISVTISKTKQIHKLKTLFPFFYNMLSEGANRKIQCRIFRR